jgi:hypothetical protein
MSSNPYSNLPRGVYECLFIWKGQLLIYIE